jgi:hypothetical protein
MDRIIGVIFPVPQEFVDRLLVEQRNIFVKYVPRIASVQITPKQRLLLYASHGSKEIVGEGLIEEIQFLTPNEVLEKYGHKVFLDKDELTSYTRRQPNRDSSKKMLVLLLSKLRKYSYPKKFRRPITMVGQYLTEKEYQELVEGNGSSRRKECAR